jgi:hypothetical protein
VHATWLGVAALVVVNAAWLRYLSLIPKERVPRRPFGALAAMALGSLLAVLSLTAPSAATMALAAPSLVLAAFFVFLLAHAPQPARLRLREGDALIPFSATTADGAPFPSSALLGRRTLLKFFRGHW